MHQYSLHDIITLSAARGSWEGVISELLPGVSEPEYRVRKRVYEAHRNSSVIVRESDISSLSGVAPTFNVGDTITLNASSGIIQAIDDETYTVDVTFQWKPNLQLTRRFMVPRWRILVEN